METKYKIKRTIQEVYDVQEGLFIKSSEFFQRPDAEIHHWRLALQEAISIDRPRLVCTHCKQMVKLCGKKTERGVVSYFSHLHDSENCDIKTNTNRTKEEIEAEKYGLVSESRRHKDLKQFMYTCLTSKYSETIGVRNVCLDKRIESSVPYLNWRCPDVSFEYNGHKIVMELQLSTTFVSVIVDRDIFYRLNNIFVIWVFNFDDNIEYVNLQNLMCKDIYYANKRNVYILDEAARKKSLEESELYFTCTWLDSNGEFSQKKLISLKDFILDEQSGKAFVCDADEIYYQAHPNSRQEIAKLELSRQELMNALKLKEDRKIQEKLLAEQRREKAIERLKLQGKYASVFEQKGKYGIKADDDILQEPIYTEITDFDENGYAIVKKGKSRGLINKYGEFLIPCLFLRAVALSKSILLYVDKIGGINYWRMIGNDKFKMEYNSQDKFLYRYVNEVFSVVEVDKTSYTPYSGYHYRHIELLVYGRITYFFSKIAKSLNKDNTYDVITQKGLSLKLTPDGLLLLPIIDGTSICTDQDGMYGVVNGKQEIIIPLIYKLIKRAGPRLYSAKTDNDKYLLLKENNEKLFNEEYDEIAYSYEDNIAVKYNSKWYIFDKNKQLVNKLNTDADVVYVTNHVYLTRRNISSEYEIYDYKGKFITQCEKIGRLKTGKLGITYMGRTKVLDEYIGQ